MTKNIFYTKTKSLNFSCVPCLLFCFFLNFKFRFSLMIFSFCYFSLAFFFLGVLLFAATASVLQLLLSSIRCRWLLLHLLYTVSRKKKKKKTRTKNFNSIFLKCLFLRLLVYFSFLHFWFFFGSSRYW